MSNLLTPARRKAIYGISQAVAACLAAFGVISGDDVSKVLLVTAAVLTVLTNMLAFANVNIEPVSVDEDIAVGGTDTE